MQEERPFHEEYKSRMKCASILCGMLLFALAAQSFGQLYVKSPTDVILPVYYVIFSVFMMSAEFGVSCVLAYFRFIEGFRGRGLFYMFVGTLSLRTAMLWDIVVAAVIFSVGFLYLVCFWNIRKPKKPRTRVSLTASMDQPAA